MDYSADLYNNACSIYPTNEVISKVTVTKWNDKIRTVTFYSDNLQVIDVVRHWGKPDHVIKNGAFFITTWEQGITIYTIAGLHYRLSYQLPAWLVTLSE